MSTAQTSARRPQPHASTAWRRWGFAGLAVIWYVLSTFIPLGLPNVAVVLVLGLLVMLSVEPDSRFPERGVAACGRNLVLALLAAAAFVPVGAGMDLLLGRIPIEAGHAVLATCAAVVVALPRLVATQEYDRPAVLGHRELIISVTALVASARMYQAAEVFVAMLFFPVLAAAVHGGAPDPARRLVPAPARRERGRCRRATSGSSLALLGAAGLTGMFFIVARLPAGGAGTSRRCVLGRARGDGRPGRLPSPAHSVAANVLVALGSVFLVVQLVGTCSAPRDAVSIGLPFTEQWQVVSGGRSALVNNHWTLGVQRDAIDFVQLVDGKTYRGDRSRLENFHIFGQPLLAVADGRVTAAVDAHPDLPVGGTTWQNMAGNHVVLDIGGGHYVLYGHLQQGSLRVQVGDQVRRGQVLGQVGDSGNSGEPHLHIQVQNTPTFDIGNREIRTYPIRFEAATASDVRRGDSVQPASP